MPDLDAAMARLKQIDGYMPMFEAAFPNDPNPVTADNAARAVAAFERTLITPNSPYDRFVEGDFTAMTGPRKRCFPHARPLRGRRWNGLSRSCLCTQRAFALQPGSSRPRHTPERGHRGSP